MFYLKRSPTSDRCFLGSTRTQSSQVPNTKSVGKLPTFFLVLCFCRRRLTTLRFKSPQALFECFAPTRFRFNIFQSSILFRLCSGERSHRIGTINRCELACMRRLIPAVHDRNSQTVSCVTKLSPRLGQMQHQHPQAL